MTPERIQRKRTKGWRMPANTRYVGSPTSYLNPWHLWPIPREEQVARFRQWVMGEILYPLQSVFERVYARPEPAEIQRQLAGINLACWCPLDQPCHADVLIEIANESDEAA